MTTRPYPLFEALAGRRGRSRGRAVSAADLVDGMQQLHRDDPARTAAGARYDTRMREIWSGISPDLSTRQAWDAAREPMAEARKECERALADPDWTPGAPHPDPFLAGRGWQVGTHRFYGRRSAGTAPEATAATPREATSEGITPMTEKTTGATPTGPDSSVREARERCQVTLASADPIAARAEMVQEFASRQTIYDHLWSVDVESPYGPGYTDPPADWEPERDRDYELEAGS
jgi:hypothetical protein